MTQTTLQTDTASTDTKFPNSQPLPDTAPSDSDLVLSYRSDRGDTVVARTYTKTEASVREVDTEWSWNYVTNRWELVSRFTYQHDLDPDGNTLAGDGSNWRGTGRQWEAWFTQRHSERLRTRFPHDDISSKD